MQDTGKFKTKSPELQKGKLYKTGYLIPERKNERANYYSWTIDKKGPPQKTRARGRLVYETPSDTSNTRKRENF